MDRAKTSAEIRQAFLDYFRANDHEIVPSSSLVPTNDPTLLFTNAGMVQFKETFLGHERRPYSRAASAQRCVRAGGKHNDLENVGYTARHHTFFEMLGNFSFGDYFKREAIQYAWEFLTEVLQLPPQRLWVTVFEEDDEAANIWLEEIGVAPERFARIGAHDNFWAMGDTGPCGPCSEIFYDHGPEVAGGPPGSAQADGDRFVEIWNLVFMQYDRDEHGRLSALPRPCVDTGMGLERIAAVVQGMHNNFEIDLFHHLVHSAARVAGSADLSNNSLRVIADHIRACAFLIVDGVFPGNEGRGYVLRRIIRRAIRHGYKLGIEEAFFYRLVSPLVEKMGAAYPALEQGRAQAERILKQEEERFRETLEQGLKLLEGDLRRLESQTIPGATIFKLYDTYGFPVDLTGDIARERGLGLDMPGFEQAMAAQRERARAASAFKVDYKETGDFEGHTEFTGYDHLQDQGLVTALYAEGRRRNHLEAGEQGMVLLDRTPFYAESGGQVGDRGWLLASELEFEVWDTVKYRGAFGHVGVVRQGRLAAGERVSTRVDAERRQATVLNHSATHLLHAALRRVLGEHAQQKGSLVAPDRLRFDFTHFEPVSREQLERVERLVNDRIRANDVADVRYMSYDEAMDFGAVALFGEKYADTVRVMRFGEFSTELCGGTHVRRTGDIGFFKLVSETGISAGIRRIEAITGQCAVAWAETVSRQLAHVGELLRCSSDNIELRLEQLIDRSRQLEKELARQQQKLASQAGTNLADRAVLIDGVKVLATTVEGGDNRALRDTLDQLKHKLGSAVVVLASVDGEKVRLVGGVTKDFTDRLKAGELINAVASQIGGRGGGRADFAQAGGSDPTQLDQALESVAAWVRERLS
ncbi:alanine--tRNA ligase [Nitrococcus mobilis]|uniref:Alanine--tRNA ligase n=1 Tax=Nitrococcus mobilis Nb-231 TaxID=314278 RepID=A4BU39_9GAMM|nr:alanine--tRNA ligase [Nitrococcus mobilis]EAR20713.1 alanyl-tRNA synthetase [Nitrococcus mobilis Nb-231]